MKKLAIIALICLTGCIFIEDVEREGFSQEDLTAPLPYNFLLQKKPIADSLLPVSYSYNISWQISDLYEGYRGAFRIEIENTGKHALFIYGFAINIDGEEQKSEWDGGKEILYGKRDTFIFSFVCPAAGEYNYRIGVYFMAKGRRWYDYGLEYIKGERQLEVKNFESASYKLYKNYYVYFDKINKLVDPYDADIHKKTLEITSKYGGNYNTAKMCAIFDWVYENVEYVNDTNDEWNEPSCALYHGGDCEEFAMLMAAMVTAAGGTARVYLTDNHAFAAVYIGKDLSLLKNIDAYYNANLSYAFFEDEFGYWLVADPLATFYIGGLPVGSVVMAKDGKHYEWSILTNKLYAIDVLKE